MNNEPKEINIKVHSLGFGDYDNFKVNPYITIEDLKKIVCQKNNFPITTIRFLYKGKSLISSSSIYDYGIKNDDMIYAVPASRIPPQYLPISFNITIQSNQPVVYHYRPDTRDFDRQINTMRSRIAEIQEACTSALLRISLTQHLLSRRDNPKSVKIPRAIIPTSGPIRTQEAETSNLVNQITPAPSINTIDLSLLSDEEKMKRYEHGCRIVQGKLLEALKVITTNVASLKQYKVMDNHGEMGAIFTREGPLPEPPTLTRDLLITNVTNGLGELFGAPGSNLVPHTIFHFPDDQVNNLQNNRNENNNNNNENQIISPTASQLFPSRISPQIPSEITSMTVQQARSQISMKPENQIKNNNNNNNNQNRHQFDSIFDRHHHSHRHRRHIRHHSRRNPFFRFNDDDDDFFNSDSDSSSSSSEDNNESRRNRNKRKRKRNSRSSRSNDTDNDNNSNSNSISSLVRIQRNIMRRMRRNNESRSRTPEESHSRISASDMNDLMNILGIQNQDLFSDTENENSNDNDNQANDSKNVNDNDNDNDNENKESDSKNANDNDNSNNNDDDLNNNLSQFFTKEEIEQLNSDKKMIEDEAENGEIPNLNPEYYRTRILDGY